VAAAKDFDIIHDEEAINKDHFGKSEFGLLEAHLKEQEQKAKDKNGNILNIKEEQPQNESKQESTVNTETSTENRDRIVLKDKHTIEHKGKFYRMNDVNAFIRTYTKRVNEALQNGKDTLAQSRSEVLDYWYSKKQELETKQQETA
jgi:hypothetical protein